MPADKPKKVQIANRHAKIIMEKKANKMYFKHYLFLMV